MVVEVDVVEVVLTAGAVVAGSGSDRGPDGRRRDRGRRDRRRRLGLELERLQRGLVDVDRRRGDVASSACQ